MTVVNVSWQVNLFHIGLLLSERPRSLEEADLTQKCCLCRNEALSDKTDVMISIPLRGP